MQQQRQKQTHLFTAEEVAEFEYCPLTWWYERFEQWAHAESEELFARLVELEHEHNTQASALPEYRMIEQLLLRQGAFEEGRQQHQENARKVEDAEAEMSQNGSKTARSRLLGSATLVLGVVALLLIVLGLLIQ